jgi:hypothetical protein
MTDQQYWDAVAKLPVFVKKGGGGKSGASEDCWVVDWRPYFKNESLPDGSNEFVLGYNPVDNVWIDPYIQYKNLDISDPGELLKAILALESRVTKLETK